MVSYVPGHDRSWWVRSALSGLGAGAAMALLETLVMGFGQGRGFRTFFDLIAWTIVPLRTHAWYVTVVGGIVHFMVAAMWGLGFGYAALYGFSRIRASWWGAAVGGLAWGAFVWAVMGLFVGPFLDPPMAALFDDLLWFGSHLVFGVVLGLTLLAWPTREQVRVTFAPVPRAVAGWRRQ